MFTMINFIIFRMVKFIKSNFEFDLDDNDYIEIIGDIEKYA